MAQANDIDERPDRRVETDRQVLANDELFPPNVERVARKDVSRDRLSQNGNATAAGNRDVDLRRNVVDEAMTGQSRHEAERSARRAVSDLEQILIDLFGVSPAVQAPRHLMQNSLISPGVQALRRQAGSARLRIGEGDAQLPLEGIGLVPVHR